MRTPVLLTIFKRPEHTRHALAAIRRARPQTLLVAADGPRTAAETEPCRQARDVLREVDWECTLLTNYAETNLGCGVRVHTAIDWALARFDEVVVVEDDCVPTASFFSFCDELLEFYRQDERVMHIGSFNFQPVVPVTPHSYYFSKYPLASGAWATWRRAWRCFDATLASWPETRAAGLVESWCSDPCERRYWTDIFDRMHAGAPDVWDYQWNYACWAHDGLAILPTVPLATNTGFGEGATHTPAPIPRLLRTPGEIHRIDHPRHMIRNDAADAYVFEHCFGGAEMRRRESRSARLGRTLAPLAWPLRAARRLARIASRRRPPTQP